jgi:hypothetical protein
MDEEGSTIPAKRIERVTRVLGGCWVVGKACGASEAVLM